DETHDHANATHQLLDRCPDDADFAPQMLPIKHSRYGRRLCRRFRYGHAEGLDVCQIEPAARRREDAVVEPNIGADTAGKDHAGEQESSGDEVNIGITRLEAM